MSWNDVEKSVEKGPVAGGFKIMLIVAALILGGTVIFGIVGYIGEGAQVAREEFGPRAMLKKYELFKDMAAQLDKKLADIKIYEGRLKSMKEDYAGTSRRDWDRTDKEQFNLWNQEVAGVKASYNGLAAEYNAAMAKFNYAFANVGTLPKGADRPLPREYKPYVNQ